jgi:hypothetical protein
MKTKLSSSEKKRGNALRLSIAATLASVAGAIFLAVQRATDAGPSTPLGPVLIGTDTGGGSISISSGTQAPEDQAQFANELNPSAPGKSGATDVRNDAETNVPSAPDSEPLTEVRWGLRYDAIARLDAKRREAGLGSVPAGLQSGSPTGVRPLCCVDTGLFDRLRISVTNMQQQVAAMTVSERQHWMVRHLLPSVEGALDNCMISRSVFVGMQESNEAEALGDRWERLIARCKKVVLRIGTLEGQVTDILDELALIVDNEERLQKAAAR